jgi:3-deoxy-manno-octulosonate cytidylyltransferase (CMP-KDO synthetase)
MYRMRKIAVIPARYAATRFPAKLMQVLGNKTVIRHTYENTVATGLFDEVLVVTDSDLIFHEIQASGGRAKMSLRPHDSGSDRIAEAVSDLGVDLVVNVQGDEPFIQKKPLEDLILAFNDPETRVASLMQKMTSLEDIRNPNIVKVAADQKSFALYFSRSVIPYPRDPEAGATFFRHIGVYGFRKETLLAFTQWPAGVLEKTEKLEQLRYLENGVRIRMVETAFSGLGIDTPEDLEKARKMI